MQIIEYFQQITQIPHCSHQVQALKTFLITFSKQHNYTILTDEANNILVRKGNPHLCLQAHYDMVCVGDAPKIETEIIDGWLSAKNSTLGADNGIAIAMMMALIEKQIECEYLFTSDEEVGLIGATALSFDLKSRYMLNLDSEDEAEVYIGCAGGIDIFAYKKYDLHECEKKFYTLEISGLPGGHSGVEIHKNIPNAMKVFAKYCEGKDIEIATIEGGERINSIPTTLKAIVASDEVLLSEQNIAVEKISQRYATILETKSLISLLTHCDHGVLKFNDTLDIPDQSINLAKLSLKDGKCHISISARAMDNQGLSEIEKKTKIFFHSFGYDVKSEGKYPAWKPNINDFSKLVFTQTQKVFGVAEYKAIHAGLECAVISDLYPNIKIASIGPNIRSPHSTHERVEIASVEKVYNVVENIIKQVNHDLL